MKTKEKRNKKDAISSTRSSKDASPSAFEWKFEEKKTKEKLPSEKRTAADLNVLVSVGQAEGAQLVDVLVLVAQGETNLVRLVLLRYFHHLIRQIHFHENPIKPSKTQ